MRVLPFTREIYIDASDFEEVPPAGYKRLIPGGEVRLRGSYVIRADEAIKDAAGNIVELRCSYDENTLGKNPEGRKVKGVIHWVPAAESVECEVRLYDRLFRSPNPEKAEEGGSFLDNINPQSLVVLTGCRAEPSLAKAAAGRALPVRARRLLLRRHQGLQAGRAGVQPHRDAARFLGSLIWR